jgi:aspartyl-tRNA(Asn)/glutamyl-tRNA(Gln) amidotransferase subunit A
VARPASAAAADASVVTRLRNAGAIPFGKTAMDQLGWSVHGRAPGFPACLNPRDTRLSPGGSSCGSAAAVAAGVTRLALGTDVAGSVRIPAAHCGVVGFKPAPGMVPLDGCMRFAASFDLVGVIAARVQDCLRGYEALTGTRVVPAEHALQLTLLDDLFDEADPGTATVCERHAAPLVRSRDRLRWRPDGFGRVLAAELARSWGDDVEREGEELYSEDVRRSVAVGRRLGDAAYREALEAFTRDCVAASRRLAAHPIVASPTVPGPVPNAGGPGDVERDTRFTRIFSALGWAAISLPAGEDTLGRPVGLQLAAPPGCEAGLFAAAAALEPES